MSTTVTSVPPQTARPIFARLYGGREEDFVGLAAQMTGIWIVQGADSDVWGALGLRPSPAHGSEVVGGVFPGADQHAAALALLRAALAVQPRLYAYAGDDLLPAGVLEAAGLHPFSAYTRMSGPSPAALPEVPAGFRIVPLSEVSSANDRMAAQRSYSDRIGHTLVPDEAADPDAFGTDDRLGQLAYDAAGVPAGLCRASLEGGHLFLGTPGVRPDARDTGLRRALLLSVCQAARAEGATRLSLDAWGDTPQERAEDAALGLQTDEFTPIYASP